MSDRNKGIACLVASAFFFALMAMFVRLTDSFGPSVSSFQKSFFRNLVVTLFAAAAFFRTTHAAGSCRCSLPLVIRCIAGTIGIVANYYALSHITIAEGQTLNKTAQFFTVIIAWLFLGERMTARLLLTLATAFGGVLLITKPGFAGSDAFPLAMGLLGGACAGIAYASTRKLGVMKTDVGFIVFTFSAFATLATLPPVVFDFSPMRPLQWVAVVGAGLSAMAAQYSITYAYRFAKAGEIAVYDYTNIIFTAALGFLVFGQVPDLWSAAGMALIILAGCFHAKR